MHDIGTDDRKDRGSTMTRVNNLLKRAGLAATALVVAALLAFGLFGCGGQQVEEQSDTDMAVESDALDTSPFWVLLVGNDTRTGTVEITKAQYADGNARSDVMMLARIAPEEHAITLISIPRDTAATVDGVTQKINAAYQSGGIEAAVDQVEQLTGVSIAHWLDIDFVQFEAFIDALGGVSVNVPATLSLQDIVGGEDITLQPGEQTLDGAQALVLSRSRKTYAGYQDACRQIQNRAIVAAGIQQVASNPEGVDAAVQALLANVDTDWDAENLTRYVEEFANHADELTIYSATGPYDGGIDAASGLWLTTRDEATWAKVIEVADAGEDPSGVVPVPAVQLV